MYILMKLSIVSVLGHDETMKLGVPSKTDSCMTYKLV